MYRRLGVLLAAVPLLLGLAGPASPPAQAVGPVRILLSGDSVTQGFDGDYTWRYRLWQEFRRQGVPVDFVGSQHLPYVVPGNATASYLDPAFDSDHFAFGSRALSWLADNIAAEVAVQQPDVVVIAAGVNDLRRGVTPDQLLGALERFVTNARAARPDLRFVVSPVLPAGDPVDLQLPAQIAAYDALLPGAVVTLDRRSSPVTLADTANGWSITADSYYLLHPNPTGETLIAQRIAETLQAVGVLPASPQVLRSVVWERNLRASVRVRHHRVRITWDRQSLTGVRIWVRRLGGPARFLRGHRPGGLHGSVRLRPGQYEVRLVAIRHRMRSPLGPATRFRVR